MYQRGQSDILSYISFDNDYYFIDQEVLDSELEKAVGNILERYSSEGVSDGDGNYRKEENFELIHQSVREIIHDVRLNGDHALIKYTKKFINYWNPSAAIFVESEIWPNMLVNIKKKSIPLILLNARITKKSYSKWKMMPSTSNILFKSFDICFSQNKETTKYLKSLGSKKIKFIGNLKFSESKTQKNNNFDNNLKKIFKSKKIWCATSTHDAEEKICLLTHKKLKNKYSNLLTIIIPRHIQRTNDIINEIKNLDLKVQTHSTNKKINKNTEIYLVDTYGETKSFFKICKTVFLGGSLINHGGQNPLEPARFGCKILHGPYIQNFTEIYKLLNQNNLSSKFSNVNQLVKLVDQSFKQNQNYTNKAIKLKKIGSNILDHTLADINYYL